MQLQQLEYVVAVVDHGSFTAAAGALGVTQPSLSQGVRALESELGTELFVRAGRQVRLTAAGEAFAEPARRALRDAATARAAVADVAGLAAGHLDLVCLPSLAADPVAALIGRFRRAHPAVTVRLAEPEDPAALGDRVRTGTSELGFAELPLGGDLVAVAVEAHDYVAVVPPGGEAHRPGPGPWPPPAAPTGRGRRRGVAAAAPAGRLGAGAGGRGAGDHAADRARGGHRPPSRSAVPGGAGVPGAGGPGRTPARRAPAGQAAASGARAVPMRSTKLSV